MKKLNLRSVFALINIFLFVSILNFSHNASADGFGLVDTVTTSANSDFENFFPAADSNGHGLAIISWTNSFGSILAAEKIDNGAWTTVTIGSSVTRARTDVAVSKSGAAIVSACSNLAIKFRYRDSSGTWGALKSFITSNCSGVKVLINSQGRAAILFSSDRTPFAQYTRGVQALIQNSDGSWPTQSVLIHEVENFLSGGPHVTGAMDDQGNILVVWDSVKPPPAPLPNRSFCNFLSYARVSVNSSTPSSTAELTDCPNFVSAVGPVVAADPVSGLALLAYGIDSGYATTPRETLKSTNVSGGGFSSVFTDNNFKAETSSFVQISELGSQIFGWTTMGTTPGSGYFESAISQISGAGVGFSQQKSVSPVVGSFFSSSPRLVQTRSGAVFGTFLYQNSATNVKDGQFTKYNPGGSALESSTIFPLTGAGDTIKGANLVAFDFDSAISVFQIDSTIYAQLYQGNATTGSPTPTPTPTATPTVTPGTLSDSCPNDPVKTEPGICGCSTPDSDTNNDQIVDCGVVTVFSKSAQPKIGSVSTSKGKITLVLEKFSGAKLSFEITLEGPNKFHKVIQSGKNVLSIGKLAKGKYKIKVKVVQKLAKGKTVSSKTSKAAISLE